VVAITAHSDGWDASMLPSGAALRSAATGNLLCADDPRCAKHAP